LNGLGAEDIGEEITYLRGRAAFDVDRRDAAESELGSVTPKSRFYSSAIYLRGVLRVKQGDYKGAEEAFCAIADVKPGDRLRFYIDGRYYALKDLARLGLGRVAHEEGRFDDAFYHYFLIPSDSKRLPEALFEAAWSSLQRKDYDLGARLIDEFLRTFPHTPRTAEARVLRATLLVKTCRFHEAEDGYDTILQEYEPLGRAIDAAVADPAQRRALALRLLGPPAGAHDPTGHGARVEEGRSPETVLAELLELDPRFELLQKLAHGLDAEAIDAGHIEELWHDLDRTFSHTAVQRTRVPLDAATLLERTQALAIELARVRAELRPKGRRPSPAEEEALRGITALEARRAALGQKLEQPLARALEGEGPGAGGEARGLSQLLRADAAHAGQLHARALRLRTRIDEAESELVRQALVALRGRIESTLRSARLGKIDAVVGQKRKVERQIEDLAAGRFPPELFGKLHLEGLIGDDEEYWPPEGERWADEYENYK
jgi:tetratricopeptide (TPR) repeat protein